MYYELYMDVFFLENFFMDYLLLLLAGTILGCRRASVRILCGALLGSLFTCAGILLPGRNRVYLLVKWIWLYIITALFMVFAAFGIQKGKALLRALVSLFLGTIVLGGVMGLVKPYILRPGSLFFFLAVLSYEGAKAVLRFLEVLQKRNGCRCRVTLYRNETVYTVNAIIDTGNLLHDPASGRPVHIVSAAFARQAWGGQRLGDVRYVPYCSIGRTDGLLPVVELERMDIHGKKEQTVMHPLVGISRESLTKEGAYEMILNGDIF